MQNNLTKLVLVPLLLISPIISSCNKEPSAKKEFEKISNAIFVMPGYVYVDIEDVDRDGLVDVIREHNSHEILFFQPDYENKVQSYNSMAPKKLPPELRKSLSQTLRAINDSGYEFAKARTAP